MLQQEIRRKERKRKRKNQTQRKRKEKKIRRKEKYITSTQHLPASVSIREGRKEAKEKNNTEMTHTLVFPGGKLLGPEQRDKGRSREDAKGRHKLDRVKPRVGGMLVLVVLVVVVVVVVVEAPRRLEGESNTRNQEKKKCCSPKHILTCSAVLCSVSIGRARRGKLRPLIDGGLDYVR